jgi:hypothetical protein
VIDASFRISFVVGRRIDRRLGGLRVRTDGLDYGYKGDLSEECEFFIIGFLLRMRDYCDFHLLLFSLILEIPQVKMDLNS